MIDREALADRLKKNNLTDEEIVFLVSTLVESLGQETLLYRAYCTVLESPGIRLKDVANRIGTSKKSATNILLNLVRWGLIEREGKPYRYQVRIY